jgi:hypothetical protein
MANGLKVKPTYEKLIEYIADPNDKISLPNRTAKFLRDGFILSQLDGEGFYIMEQQREQYLKEEYKESLLKLIAANTGIDARDLRQEGEHQRRQERHENMFGQGAQSSTEYHDISDPAHDAKVEENAEEEYKKETERLQKEIERIKKAKEDIEEELKGMDKRSAEAKKYKRHAEEWGQELQNKVKAFQSRKSRGSPLLFESGSSKYAKTPELTRAKSNPASAKAKSVVSGFPVPSTASGSGLGRGAEQVNPESSHEPKGRPGRPRSRAPPT